jgi:hypothetical protein
MHDLYLCVSMTGPFVIGSKVQRLNGVYRTSDRQEIVHVGFNHPRVDALAADPRDPSTLHIAALNGALRSLDGGQTWRIMTGWDMTEPKGLAVDPHYPDRVYLALPDGIALSENRGETWRRLRTGIRRAYTQAVVVDREMAGRVLAATELGVFLTEGEGQAWRLVLPSKATVTDLQQSPRDPQRFLASTQEDGAWMSIDRGRTWQQLRSLPTTHTLHNVQFDPTNDRRLAVSGWEVGVQVSEDGGATWIDRSAGLPNRRVWRVACDPDFAGRLYASPHESPICVSEDFGRTWRPHWFEGATLWGFAFVRRQPLEPKP